MKLKRYVLEKRSSISSNINANTVSWISGNVVTPKAWDIIGSSCQLVVSGQSCDCLEAFCRAYDLSIKKIHKCRRNGFTLTRIIIYLRNKPTTRKTQYREEDMLNRREKIQLMDEIIWKISMIYIYIKYFISNKVRDYTVDRLIIQCDDQDMSWLVCVPNLSGIYQTENICPKDDHRLLFVGVFVSFGDWINTWRFSVNNLTENKILSTIELVRAREVSEYQRSCQQLARWTSTQLSKISYVISKGPWIISKVNIEKRLRNTYIGTWPKISSIIQD